MKRLLPCLLAALVAAPGALRAAQFEGKVAFNLTAPQRPSSDPASRAPQELVYQIKGGKMRMDLPASAAGAGAVIFDSARKETTIIMDAQRMYMVQPMPEAGAPAANDRQGPAPTLEKTGQKETILGYVAEKFLSTSDGNTSELWLAEGLGTFMAFHGGGPMGGRGRGRGGPPPQQGWEKALAGKDLFPLRVVTKNKDGSEFRMEATAIEKKSLPDSLFAPPADYQKFDMGGMMRGMMPGGMRP